MSVIPALVAGYTSAAVVVNTMAARTVLPEGNRCGATLPGRFPKPSGPRGGVVDSVDSEVG